MNQHLNEDNVSKTKSDQQFQKIYKTLMDDMNLKCDINECIMYKRNNRQRENTLNTANKDIINVEMDILDSIHCYFMHSIDDGINNNQEEKKENTNIDKESEMNEYFDAEINNLRVKLSKRVNRMTELRGINRIKQSKFVTQTSYKKGMLCLSYLCYLTMICESK